MPLTNRDALLRPLHLLAAHIQHTHHARLFLALSMYDHDIPLLHLRVVTVPTRQTAPLTRHARRHQRRAAQHEPDRAAVDAQAAEALRVGVHDAQVRHQRVVHVLPEEWRRLVVRGRVAEHVQRHPVRQLDRVQLRLLGDQRVDVGRQERVGLEDPLADRPCDRGFYFGFG